MEQQDLLNALKGKRLHWRDEDNENDGVIDYITTTKEDEYILLFDNFAQVTIDRLHIEELVFEGHTCDKRYTYCLDESPIESIRKALVGKRLRWGDERDVSICFITDVRVNKVLNEVIVFAVVAIPMEFPTVYELIAKGESSDEHYQYRLLGDEESTTITGDETATSTSREVTFADGIDWEGRTWHLAYKLYCCSGAEQSVRQDDQQKLRLRVVKEAREFVKTYRKNMEGER